MEKVNMTLGTIATKNSEIDNTKEADLAHAPANASDALVNQTDAQETASEPAKEERVEEQKPTMRRHSVIYLAGGIWKDAEGVFWCRESMKNCITSKTFSEEEFAKRADVQYMIEYGAMKDVISE